MEQARIEASWQGLLVNQPSPNRYKTAALESPVKVFSAAS